MYCAANSIATHDTRPIEGKKYRSHHQFCEDVYKYRLSSTWVEDDFIRWHDNYHQHTWGFADGNYHASVYEIVLNQLLRRYLYPISILTNVMMGAIFFSPQPGIMRGN